jgi:DNA-directed RNA polymerase subunit RPC12/RpoP
MMKEVIKKKCWICGKRFEVETDPEVLEMHPVLKFQIECMSYCSEECQRKAQEKGREECTETAKARCPNCGTTMTLSRVNMSKKPYFSTLYGAPPKWSGQCVQCGSKSEPSEVWDIA